MSVGETAVADGRYVLEERIGRGGMADVYRAVDRILDRPVAIKLLREMTGDPADKERFAAEARTLAKLSHPSLVAVLDADMDAERPFLVLELVDGPSLAARLPEPLAAERVRTLGAQVADALAYAHAAGVVHRDVKPGNVLLGRDGRARLTDFGIARLLGDATRHTKTGFTIGTAAYLAPEQVRGEPVTPAADVYSLALVLIEALTGTRVFPGSPTEAALARLHRAPEIPASVPTDLQPLLAGMVDQDPGRRPAAAQVAAALSDADPAPSVDRTRVLASSAPPQSGPEASTFVLQPRTSSRIRPRLATLAEHAASNSRALWSRLSLWQPNGLVVFLAAVLGVVLVVGAYALSSGDDTAPVTKAPAVPAHVPDRLQQPLQDLHDAVTGERP